MLLKDRYKEEMKSIMTLAQRYADAFGPTGLDEPDDIVQKALVKVLKRRDSRPPRKNWIYKVVRSLVFDSHNKHTARSQYITALDEIDYQLAVRESAGVNQVVENLLYGSESAIDEEESEELIRRVELAMAELSHPLRTVLELYAQDNNYEAIAKQTGVRIGTVRSRLHYARRKVRQLLKQSD
jgi:RNA polymerase sigma-70 factor (ECF subfamily)